MKDDQIKSQINLLHERISTLSEEVKELQRALQEERGYIRAKLSEMFLIIDKIKK